MDLSIALAGSEVSLEKAASDSNAPFASAPLSRLPYHWIRQAEDPGQTQLELAWFQDVCVVDAFILYVPATRQFVTEVSYPRVLTNWRIPHTRQGDVLTLTSRRPVVEIADPVFLIGGQGNHYHWLLNWLPRLLVLRRLGNHAGVPSGLKFAVHHGISAQHLDVLALCGVKPGDVIRLRPDSYRYRLKQALVSNFFSSHCYYREVLDFLYRLGKRVPPASNWGLYISRNELSVPRRRIRNEEALAPILERFDVRRVVLETMPIRDQIAAFRGASAIIAAHGAGLANLPFASRGSDLLLFEYKRVSEFAELAMLSDIRCSMQTPLQVPDEAYEAADKEFDVRNRDFVIDPAVVAEFLTEVERRHPRPSSAD